MSPHHSNQMSQVSRVTLWCQDQKSLSQSVSDKVIYWAVLDSKKVFYDEYSPPPCKVDHLPPLVHVEVIERGVEGAAVPDGGDVGGDIAHLVIGFGIIPANFQHNHYFVSPQLREGDQSWQQTTFSPLNYHCHLTFSQLSIAFGQSSIVLDSEGEDTADKKMSGVSVDNVFQDTGLTCRCRWDLFQGGGGFTSPPQTHLLLLSLTSSAVCKIICSAAVTYNPKSNTQSV